MKQNSHSVTVVSAPSVFCFGPFHLDVRTAELRKNNHKIRLQPQPFRILLDLLERPGELLSREEIKAKLWPDNTVVEFDHSINAAIKRLRDALQDCADRPRYIETLPRLGYRFIAPVSRSPLGSSTPPDQPVPAPATAPAPYRNRGDIWLIGCGLALVITAFVSVSRVLQPTPNTLFDGATRPSANRAANDQFNLAFHLIDVQGDVSRARQASERAISLNPSFEAAHVQHALFSIIDLWTGSNNDFGVVLLAEKEIHEAENKLPDNEGLLLVAKTAVYLAQGRLDRVPAAKLNDFTRKGADPTWLAILRLLAGETDEAIDLLRHWIERDPLHNPPRMFLGELLRTKGETKQALSLLDRTLEQSPRNTTAAAFLTLAYLDSGRTDEAEALLLPMRREFEKNYLWRCAFAILLAAEGKHDEAAQVMDEETLKFARLSWPQWSSTAEFYALQGDRDKALEWLEFAMEHGDERAFYFRRDSRLVSLRSDPRFQLLLRDMESRQAAFH